MSKIFVLFINHYRVYDDNNFEIACYKSVLNICLYFDSRIKIKFLEIIV